VVRTAYGAQLDALTDQMADVCRTAGSAMERATRSLLEADLSLAECVIDDHETISEASAKAEESGFALLALWAPVARDLRATISSIQIAADAERMGALAVHVAKIARRRHPECALPEEVNGFIAEMSRIAIDLGESARNALTYYDPDSMARIRADSDVMERLHRHLLAVLTEREWRHGTAAAIDVTLVGRSYHRFADHAVQISRRVIFRSTGRMPARGDGVSY
jgi:phosphate transport system protein